jgi:GNAT superfamily N-acetyltransferase
MTLPDAWRRVRQRLFATRKFVVIRKKLEVFPVPDRLGEVVFRQASATDLARLDDLEAHGRGSTQRAHVRERHDMLFVACHGDRILATRRCGLEVRDPLAARVVQLRPGQVWVADLFCLPEYRSHGVGTHLILFTDRELAVQRYTEVLAAVDAGNISSLRASRSTGFDFPFYVSYVRVLRYERLRVHDRLPRRLRALLT